MAISSKLNNIVHDDVVAVSGDDYVTDWFPTDDIRTVVVDVEGPQQGWSVQQSVNGSQAFSNGATELAHGEFLISTRYIRLNVDVNGSGTLMVSMRVGSRI